MMRYLRRVPITVRRALFLAAIATALSVAVVRPSAADSVNREAILKDIADKTAQLAAPRKTVEFTWEKAHRVTVAIHDGEYGTARRIIEEVLHSSRLTPFRFYPFGDFVDQISDTDDVVFEDHLNTWVQDKKDALSLLIRARYYYDKGWAVRGPEYANKTSILQMAGFEAYSRKALADVDASIGLDDKNPYTFYLKLKVLQGHGLSPEMTSAFKEAIGKHPDYYWLYRIMMQTIAPRWGGTVDEMKAFVSHYADNAPEGSPLKALYISLYRSLLTDVTGSYCPDDKKKPEEVTKCFVGFVREYVTPDLEKKVEAAFHLYDHVDKYEFSVFVASFLQDIQDTRDADAYAGPVLQLAANAMHTDTRNREDQPHDQNNFMIDLAVGDSWYTREYYPDAKKKYLEALSHAGATEFPDEEAKDVAFSTLYDRLSQAAARQREYIDTIVYQQAAIDSGGNTGREEFICYGYFMLELYDEAIKTCTEALNKHKNKTAYYWRAQALVKLDRNDDALQDLAATADNKGMFHGDAAIQMTTLYFNRNNVQAGLDVLNKYPFLYDAENESKATLAVAYNNRCYAYMKLDQLAKALDDCTKSLQYGNLPDAYHKQQELVARLKKQ